LSVESCVGRPYANSTLTTCLPQDVIDQTRALFEAKLHTSPIITNGATQQERSEFTDIESRVRDEFSRFSRYPASKILKKTTIFQLGLDSINALQLASNLREAGYNVTGSDILQSPSVESLAQFLEQNYAHPIEQEAAFDFATFNREYLDTICLENSISEKSIEDIKPTTAVQQGILARYIQSDGQEYLNHIHLELESGVSQATLESAFEAVVEAHQILRTGFAHIKNSRFSFAMVSYQSFSFNIPFTALKEDDAKTWDVSTWRQNCSQEIQQRLHHPPWRVLFQPKNGRSSLHLLILHSLYDAHSLNLIFDDLASAIKGSVSRRPAFNPVLGAILNASADSEAHKLFWKEQGAKFVFNRFPIMTPLRVSPRKIGTFAQACSQSLLTFRRNCQKANVTMQAAGQAAWARLLASYTGEQNVTFAIVLSGRTQDGSDAMSFPCITTVPFSCTINTSNGKLLEQAMKFNASVQNHQFTPISKIQAWAGCPNTSLFDTLFAFQMPQNSRLSSRPWSIVEENSSADVSSCN